MIIVADTTPLSELAKVGHLNLLQDAFRQVTIPQEVYRKVTTSNHSATANIAFMWVKIRSNSPIASSSAISSRAS